MPGTSHLVQATPDGATTLPQPGDSVAGKYTVERTLGQGGMGVVLAARRAADGAQVAVKMLLGVATESRVERFMREARAAQSLTSEHVVRVFDFGVQHGVPFMVMEHLAGGDLGARLASAGRLGVAEAVDLVLQACEGLAHAHRVGIVHRDIKPSNLFVTPGPDGAPLVKVLDFGIAKDLERAGDDIALTATRAVLGSPPYMSPEQVRRPRDVDARTDVWSLGATLYTMLVARPPFPGDHVGAVYAAIVADPPVPLASLHSALPLGLEQTIHWTLEKQLDERCPSVLAFARALQPFATALGQRTCARIAERFPEYDETAQVPSLAQPHGSMTATDPRALAPAPPGPAVPTHSGVRSVGDAPRRPLAMPAVLGAIGVALLGVLGVVGLVVVRPYFADATGASPGGSAAEDRAVGGVASSDVVPAPVAPKPGSSVISDLPVKRGSAFDLSGNVSTAVAAARKKLPGAGLAIITFSGAGSDGRVDLSDDDSAVNYGFIKADRCVFAIPSDDTWIVTVESGAKCWIKKPVRLPKCGLASVVKRARRQLKVPQVTKLTGTYLAGPGGSGIWNIATPSNDATGVPDDC